MMLLLYLHYIILYYSMSYYITSYYYTGGLTACGGSSVIAASGECDEQEVGWMTKRRTLATCTHTSLLKLAQKKSEHFSIAANKVVQLVSFCDLIPLPVLPPSSPYVRWTAKAAAAARVSRPRQKPGA